VVSIFVVAPLCWTHVENVAKNITTRETPRIPEGCQFWRPKVHQIKWVAVKVDYQKSTGETMDMYAPMEVDLADYPYRQSLRQNCLNVMGAHFWEWFLPLEPTRMHGNRKWWDQEFNEATKEKLRLGAKEQIARFEELLLEKELVNMAVQSQGQSGDLGGVNLSQPEEAHLRSKIPIYQ
jgi:hypothetical protein